MWLRCITILYCLVAGLLPATGQYGFNQRLTFEGSDGLDIDDILYDDEGIVIRGNIWVNDLQRWGLFVCRMDTTGAIEWSQTYIDPEGANIVTNTPTRFIKTSDGGFLIPSYYFERNNSCVFKLDSVGQIEFVHEYPNTERTIFTNYLMEYDGYYYISGHLQHLSFDIDVILQKISLEGEEIWLKHYGTSQYGEFSAGMVLMPSGIIAIGSYVNNDPFSILPFEEIWLQPWIIFVDTSGVLIDEWKGQQNDPRTKAATGVIQTRHKEWITFYNEYEYDPIYNSVFTKAAVSMMDSTYSLLWKKEAGEFNAGYNSFYGAVYDSIRDELIIAGQIIVADRMMGYITKVTTTGQTLWEVYENSRDEAGVEHWLAGVCLAPSGSIYAAGYINYYDPFSKRDGWILKVTSDGCVDTLCTTTSILDQIRPRDNVYIYPNPASDQISVSWQAKPLGQTILECYTSTGLRVLRTDLNEYKNEISIVNLPPGLLHYRIIHEGVMIKSGTLVKTN